MKKMFFKDFQKKRVRLGFLSSREETDQELMATVNEWLGRVQEKGVNVINVETIYRFGQTGIAIVNGFMGVRVWYLYEAKKE